MKVPVVLSLIGAGTALVIPPTQFFAKRIRSSSLLRQHVVKPRPLRQRTAIYFADSPDSAASESKITDIDIDREFLRQELSKLETLEEILDELEEFEGFESGDNDIDNDLQYSFGKMIEQQDLSDQYLWDPDSLSELLSGIGDDDSGSDLLQDVVDDEDQSPGIRQSAAKQLEQALLQGVVPVTASVGANMLPGDFGFDPLHLATKDYFKQVQHLFLRLLPLRDGEEPLPPSPPFRPAALILRDYRECEARHSRLAMLAAIFWPLQELLDRFILDDDQFGPLVYGPVTLPYFPLIMTAIMMLLGYLDIYSQAIKDLEGIGDAYLPGDCFWDPLRMLQGAPDSMKRSMQERELFNGRASMLAVLAYMWEELVTHKPLIEIESNVILFTPAYQIPFIQSWLDSEFSDTLEHASDAALQSVGDTSDLISSLF